MAGSPSRPNRFMIAPVPPQTVVSESCQVSPALRIWIESQVDARVEFMMRRQIREGELAGVLALSRREGAASASAATQVDQDRRWVEAEVRSLAEAQQRILAVVDRLSGDLARQQGIDEESRGGTVSAVEQVIRTVDELQRAFEEDGKSVYARLSKQEATFQEACQSHGASLQELRHLHTDRVSRQEAALAELQRLQVETSAKQLQCTDELAGCCATVVGTRREVGDLAHLVQRLELRLSGWRAEVTAEVVGDVERRLEALQHEFTAAVAAQTSFGARLESFQSECSASTLRLNEGQLGLDKRMGTIQNTCSKDVESLRQEADSIANSVQCLDQRLSAWWSEATCGASARSELESRLEHFQAELVCATAARNASEERFRESHEQFKRSVDASHEEFRDEFSSLQRRATAEVRAEVKSLKIDQHTLVALDEQLWLTDQRLGQRIDKLAQSQERAAVASAASAALASVAAEGRGCRCRIGKMAHGPLETVSPSQTLLSAALAPQAAWASGDDLASAEQLKRLQGAKRGQLPSAVSWECGHLEEAARPPSRGPALGAANSQLQNCQANGPHFGFSHVEPPLLLERDYQGASRSSPAFADFQHESGSA